MLATSGPGATNLVTGIATAYMDSVPLVAFTGNVATPGIGKDCFQEAYIEGITMPITKHNFTVRRVEDLPDLLEIVGKIDAPLPCLGGQAHVDHVRQQRAQAVIVAVEVVKDARRVQLPERDAGHHLRDLLERARAAGEGDERIAQLQHLRLALREVARHDQLRQPVVQEALIDKEARLDARHLAARGEHALGECAHEPVCRPAVDKRVAALADPAAKCAHRVAQRRVIARVCAQIDCNVHVFSPFPRSTLS